MNQRMKVGLSLLVASSVGLILTETIPENHLWVTRWLNSLMIGISLTATILIAIATLNKRIARFAWASVFASSLSAVVRTCLMLSCFSPPLHFASLGTSDNSGWMLIVSNQLLLVPLLILLPRARWLVDQLGSRKMFDLILVLLLPAPLMILLSFHTHLSDFGAWMLVCTLPLFCLGLILGLRFAFIKFPAPPKTQTLQPTSGSPPTATRPAIQLIRCRTCGTEVPEKTGICPSCGVKPLNGRSFCQACGAETREKQEQCVKCNALLDTVEKSAMREKLKHLPRYYRAECLKIYESDERYRGKWNWAAFFFGPLWALFNGLWLATLVSMVLGMVTFGLAFFLVCFIYGVRGNWIYYSVRVKEHQIVI